MSEINFSKFFHDISNLAVELGKEDITENIENQFKTFIKELADFLKNHDNLDNPSLYKIQVQSVFNELEGISKMLEVMINDSFVLEFNKSHSSNKKFDQLKFELNEILKAKKILFNHLVRLNTELNLIFSADLVQLKSKSILSKLFEETPIQNANYAEPEMDTVSIAQDIKKFLRENKISAQQCSQSILKTSILTFRNLIDTPKPYSSLNKSFKLYYQRLFTFLNSYREQQILISKSKQARPDDFFDDDTNNTIYYEISQVEISDIYLEVIKKVIKKVKTNRLTRKLLCDCILGIPLNTFSFFCKKLKTWNEHSDYAKDSIMRLYAWLIDPDGVTKVLEWKKKYYSTQMVKATCVSRTRHYLTKQQIFTLHLEYGKSNILNYDRIQCISRATNLNELTIRTWFRNKRYNYEVRSQRKHKIFPKK